MCYNATSSIANNINVTLFSAVVYLYGNKYDKHFALFLFVVIQMQLAEFFMHTDQQCKQINKIGTLSGLFIIYFQRFQ